VDGLAGHVEPVCHLDDRNTIADDREHCLVRLLHDTQLPQQAGSVTDQVDPGVTHQAELRNASAGADVSRVSRNQTPGAWGGEDSDLRPADYEREKAKPSTSKNVSKKPDDQR
jgi:hypothetical protein